MAVVLAGATLGLAPDGLASNFSGVSGGTGCSVNMADNADHSFFYVSPDPDTAKAVSWSRVNNYDPTDLNTLYEPNGLNSLTDVVVQDADYEGSTCGMTWMSSFGSGGMAGLVRCQSLAGNLSCQQHLVDFDNDWMGPRSATEENSLACHELGHTVGLMHASSGCMFTPTTTVTTLTDHDRSHINANY